MKNTIFAVITLFVVALAHAETIGSVNTAIQLLGPDAQLTVEAFDDPKVSGVSCYLSRAKRGGILATLGMAEDTSNLSVGCRQVGAIAFQGALPLQQFVKMAKAAGIALEPSIGKPYFVLAKERLMPAAA